MKRAQMRRAERYEGRRDAGPAGPDVFDSFSPKSLRNPRTAGRREGEKGEDAREEDLPLSLHR
jgi:hypothetical protein